MEPIDILILAIAGGIGGGLLGFLGWLQAQKEGEKFDGLKFAKSVIPAIVVGAATGVATENFAIAFLSGLGIKAVWEKSAPLIK